jgi:hypothetical protein
MNLVWCACGKLVRYAGETRCEDCFADEQAKYHIQRNGNSKRLNINTTVRSSREGCDVPLTAEDRAARRRRA